MNLPERGFYPGSVDLFTGQPIPFVQRPPEPTEKPVELEATTGAPPALHKRGDPEGPDNLLTLAAAAWILGGLKRESLRRACECGAIPCVDRGHGSYRWAIYRRDLDTVRARLAAWRPDNPMPDGYITSGELARRLNVTPKTARKFGQQGRYGARQYHSGARLVYCFRADLVNV